MNKICFIMPIYPPHFEYANAFLRSFFTYRFDAQADLAFVFTNADEARAFKNINFAHFYKTLILPKILRTTRENGIINIKKFYALKKLHKRYKYLIIIDSESELIKSVNLAQLCDEFYANKLLFGNATICDSSEIKAQSKKFFVAKSTQKIPNDDLYFWFNQPCIYKGDFVAEFFNATNLAQTQDFLRLNFWSFDFYIYGYFLLLYKDFRIENVECVAGWGFLECVDFAPQSEKFKEFAFYCCHYDLLTRLNTDKLFLVIQKDKHKRDLVDLVDEIFAYHLGAIFARYGTDLISQMRLMLMLGTIKRIFKINKRAFYKCAELNQSLRQNAIKDLQIYIKSSHLYESVEYKIGDSFIKALNAVNHNGGDRLWRKLRKCLKPPKFLHEWKFIFWDLRVILKQGSENASF
ncbi:hypothetical protein [Helicobacter sp. T3_23-1059]